LLKDITFGQYFDTKSIVHSLDPRIKILLLILQIVFIFITKNIYALLLAFLFVLLSVIFTKVPIKIYLKNFKAILPIIIFTALINLFYTNEGKELFGFWKLTLTTGGIYKAFYFALRIVLLIAISSVLTYTTTPNDLTDAIERLLSPLKILGLKNAVHTLAMMMTIALRFIPTLVEETQKIMNAQKARGADFENGRLKEKINALIPILIPLLISSVRRAYELAEAMECRCYSVNGDRQRMKILKCSAKDLFAFLFCLIFCLGIAILNYLF